MCINQVLGSHPFLIVLHSTAHCAGVAVHRLVLLWALVFLAEVGLARAMGWLAPDSVGASAVGKCAPLVMLLFAGVGCLVATSYSGVGRL